MSNDRIHFNGESRDLISIKNICSMIKYDRTGKIFTTSPTVVVEKRRCKVGPQ